MAKISREEVERAIANTKAHVVRLESGLLLEGLSENEKFVRQKELDFAKRRLSILEDGVGLFPREKMDESPRAAKR